MENTKFCQTREELQRQLYATRSIFSFSFVISMRILFTYSCRRQTCPTRITFTRIYRIAYPFPLVDRERNTSDFDENFSKINISIETRIDSISNDNEKWIASFWKKKKKESYVSMILIKLEQFNSCKCIPAISATGCAIDGANSWKLLRFQRQRLIRNQNFEICRARAYQRISLYIHTGKL